MPFSLASILFQCCFLSAGKRNFLVYIGSLACSVKKMPKYTSLFVQVENLFFCVEVLSFKFFFCRIFHTPMFTVAMTA